MKLGIKVLNSAASNWLIIIVVYILQDQAEIDAKDNAYKYDAHDSDADTQVDHGPGRVGTGCGRGNVATCYSWSGLKQKEMNVLLRAIPN